MTTATLTALNTDAGVNIRTIVLIEGCPYVLTDGDPELAQLTVSNSSGTGYSDFGTGLSGLTVHWDLAQKIEPWKPFPDPPTLTFSVVPAQDSSGDLTISDAFGQFVGKRVASTETHLTADLDCDGASFTVQRADDFAASGEVFIGPEAIGYTSRDTGTDTFSNLTRGKYSPFHADGGARFSRTHKPIDLANSTGTPIGVRLQPVVSSSPTSWIGKWVGVWFVRDQVGDYDRLEDAHLAFAGYIAEIGEDERGAVVVTCESVQRRIYETVLLRNQFRAKLKEGYYLAAGDTFSAFSQRQVNAGGTTNGTANDLVVVSSGAAGANQIDAGIYSASELLVKLNRWLAAEKAAARLLFNANMGLTTSNTTGVTKIFLSYDDPTTTAGLDRSLSVAFPDLFAGKFFGLGDQSIGVSSTSSRASTIAPEAPRRFQTFGGGAQRVGVTEMRGSYISQASTLPAALANSATFEATGIVKIGDAYFRAKQLTSTTFSITAEGTRGYFQPTDLTQTLSTMTIDDDSELEISQVVVMEGKFNSLLLKILASTGTSTFNHATYDVLDEQLGCAIPWSILENDSTSMIIDLLRVGDGGDKSLCAVIDKPTRFVDLFEADFLIRNCFFRWGQGYLGVGGWAAPSSALSTVTLDETSKRVPAASAASDAQRASLREDDGSLYNVVSFKYGRQSDGKYSDIYTIEDADSIRSHGTRARTIELINTLGTASKMAALVLLEDFAANFPIFSRPFYRIKRTVGRTHYEQTLPGTKVTLTDKYLRDPTTGLRYDHRSASGGLSSQPALVIGLDFDWGGPGRDDGGEVELMVLPRTRFGPYAPCAQVDDTAANAGYNAGTKVLTCYAHEHSAATEVADATRFVAGDAVRVVEIDPSNAAAPLTWLDTVASQTGNTITLTVGLAGWDTTKKYRITFADYTTCGATQKAHTFLADDADGLVADSRQSYQMIGAAGSSYTQVTSATDLAVRHATLAYSEGNPLDTGYERDIARNLNNFREYKSAPQCPQTYNTARTYSAGTWTLVEIIPVFLQLQTFQVFQTRRIYLSPTIRSTSGATAECRVTLSPFPPNGTTLADVTRVEPYVSTTFTTTSTSFNAPTDAYLDYRHCMISPTGIAYLYVEVKSITEYKGLVRRRLGPVETP